MLTLETKSIFCQVRSLKIKKTHDSTWMAVNELLLVGHKVFEGCLHTIIKVFQTCIAAGAKLLHHYVCDKDYWTCHILWLFYWSAERKFFFAVILSVLKLTLLETYCICVIKCLSTTKTYCQTCKDFNTNLKQETEYHQGDMIHESCSLKRNGNYPIHGQHLTIRVYKVLCFSNTNEKTFKTLIKSNMGIVCGYSDFHENPV